MLVKLEVTYPSKVQVVAMVSLEINTCSLALTENTLRRCSSSCVYHDWLYIWPLDVVEEEVIRGHSGLVDHVHTHIMGPYKRLNGAILIFSLFYTFSMGSFDSIKLQPSHQRLMAFK